MTVCPPHLDKQDLGAIGHLAGECVLLRNAWQPASFSSLLKEEQLEEAHEACRAPNIPCQVVNMVWQNSGGCCLAVVVSVQYMARL